MSKEEKDKVEIVTEEDLQKALDKMEGKEEKPKEEIPPKLEVVYLKKTAAELVQEKGSEELRKALDVSGTLSEFAALIEVHVDESLLALQKGLDSAAQRDMSMIKVLETMTKSIEALKEEVKKYGELPGLPAGLRQVTTAKASILSKTVDGKEVKTEISKKDVKEALIRLHKAADRDEKTEFFTALSTYEATNTIPDGMLAKALDNHRTFYGKKVAA